MDRKKFWRWARNTLPDPKNPEQEIEERTLFLNGTIAEESWFDDDVTPALFKSDLNGGKGDITVWINSPGGDCFAAAQIYNMLTDYPGKVTVKIDGLAASAASVIAMAGDRVMVSPVSMIMIHNPATIASGDKADMEKAIDMLQAVKDSIINAYSNKTGLSRNKLSKLMDEETWMDAQMAFNLHFADEIMTRPGMKKDQDDLDEEKEDESDKEGTEKKTGEDDEKKASGMLYSSHQMALTFQNKVRQHYAEAEKKPEIINTVKEKEPKGRSVDELMQRLNFLHSIF